MGPLEDLQMAILCRSKGNLQQMWSLRVEGIHSPLKDVKVSACCSACHVFAGRHGWVPEQALLGSWVHLGSQEGCIGMDPLQERKVPSFGTLGEVTPPAAAVLEQPLDDRDAAMVAGCLHRP